MNKKQILNWILVIVWVGVIYWFSHQPNLKSELEPFWDLIFRKIAHMAEYFVLTFFIFQAVAGHNIGYKKSLMSAAIFSVAYAGLDEWHQSFIFNRHGSIIDVGIDSIGVFSFLILKIIYGKNLSN